MTTSSSSSTTQYTPPSVDEGEGSSSMSTEEKSNALNEVVSASSSTSSSLSNFPNDKSRKRPRCNIVERKSPGCEECNSPPMLQQISSNSSSPPPRKKLKSDLFIYKYDKTELEKMIKSYAFTMIVFYRGGWCSICKEYLKSINEVVSKIEQHNGKVLAISAESEQESIHTFQTLELKYPLMSDEKNVLAKELDVVIMEKNSETWEKTKELMLQYQSDISALTNEETFGDGITQPAIVVYNQNQEIIFHWKNAPLLKNFYGATQRITVEYALKIVLDILKPRTKNPVKNSKHLFERILNMPSLKQMFMRHLEQEMSSDLLHFVDEVANFSQLTLLPDLLREGVRIYRMYIKNGAPNQVNLSATIVFPLHLWFETTHPIAPPQPQIFDHAAAASKELLFLDCFKRFESTKEFIDSLEYFQLVYS